MDGTVVIETSIDTKQFDRQIKYIEQRMLEIEYLLEQADKGFEVGDTLKLEAEYEKLGNQLRNLIQKKEELNNAGTTQLQNEIGKIGGGISNVISKVAKWSLAVIGVRSAYMGIRRAISLVQSENENIAGQFNAMRTVIANAFLPIVQNIVNFLVKIMVYINYIYSRLTGKNLFDFSKVFKDTRKNAVGTAKAVKQIKKELAGFDEMNVLSDNSSSSGAGGGGGGGSVPSLPDASLFTDVPIPEWLKWIVDNGNLILAIISGIVAGITAFKIETLLAKEGIIDAASAVEALGIGIIVAGIVMLIKDIIDMINDPSWANFVAILGDMAIIIGGLMLLFGNWWGLLVAGIGLVVKLVAENWDTIKGILSKVWSWIKEKIITPLGNAFSPLFTKIKNGFKSAVDFVKSTFNSVVSFFKNLISKIVGLFKNIGTKVGDTIGGAFKAVINGILKAIESILNFPIKSVNKLLDVINKVPGINISKLSTFSLPRLAKGGILNMPGRGVPIAIGGERGQEGVIPLTDSQQMALLGEAIGKYITINANITNTMNGRIISRELQKIQQENSFASNR